MDVKTKSFNGRVKDFQDNGVVTVVFATLETIDKDGDWLTKGSIGKQNARVVGAHNWKQAPLGVASIYEDGDEAIAELKFNLEMPSAKEWYDSLKFTHEHGVKQEYSFGFDVLDSERGQKDGKQVRICKKFDIHEISPVMIGAGVNTRTLEVKDDKAYAELSGTWEQAQEKIRQAAHALLIGDRDGWCGLQGTYSDRVVISCYYYSDDGSETKYYQFDWSMNAAGDVTLTNQQEVELQVVVTAKQFTLAEHFSRVTGEVVELAHRQRELAALKVKEGRTLSRANRERLGRLVADLNALLVETDKPEESSEEPKSHTPEELYARFVQSQLRAPVA